jgi:histidinol-phosphate aminotransferase
MSQEQPRVRVADHIAALRPYVAGKPIEELRRERNIQGPIVKLASNENPLGASPKALEAVHAALRECQLYPDPACWSLRQALSARLGVDPGRIVVGNGSDELMNLTVHTFAGPGDHGLYSQYAFAAYWLNYQSEGLSSEAVPATAALGHDLEAIAAAVTPRTRMIFLGNPNNPTGSYFGREALEGLLERLRALPEPPIVALDEAYFEFADAPDYPDSLTLHARYPRLVTFRTFSKCYGLASLRVGYAVYADPAMAHHLNAVRKPFNVNRVGQAAATAALEDEDFLRRTLALNRQERARVSAALQGRGFFVWPSQANFVLVQGPLPGAALQDRLLDEGVITRPVDNYGLTACLRISIGTPEENDRLLAALDAVLGRLHV